jgi:hypothetical protein
LADREVNAGLTGDVRCQVPLLVAASVASAGFRLPAEVIVLAVRWYLRSGVATMEHRLLQELIACERVLVTRSSSSRP